MISAMTVSGTTPTSPYSKELVEHLLPYAELKKYPARKKLFFNTKNEQFCYLLIDGQATLHKEENNLVLATLSPPALIGLAHLPNQSIQGYIKPVTACDIGVLTIGKVHEILAEKNLWQMTAQHMIFLFNKLYAINQNLTVSTSYGQVKAQLLELLNEDSAIRDNLTAERYIRDKTNLSRSGVMRILSALKEGGYIETHRGILKKINSLPDKF
ncbi:Crp/Fnr family transcriptional regulator [Enterobacteriaceae bacterium 89]|nr:Crp/Fnr family transcriptional regulator [Enterobacteriaceae bacterium 89]